MANTHTHTISFTGMVPGTEIHRTAIYSADVRAAVDALGKALNATGFTHTVEQTVKAPRKARAPETPAVAAVGAGRHAAE